MTAIPVRRAVIPRAQTGAVISALREDACVAITGPYDVGKSELARHIAAEAGVEVRVLALNTAADRDELTRNPALITGNAGKLLVLDEVHMMPDSLELIRDQCDVRRREGVDVGQFLLAGAPPILTSLVSDRLSTRCRAFDLAPVSIQELPQLDAHRREATSDVIEAVSAVEESATPTPDHVRANVERLWVRGGFPLSLTARDDAASRDYRERYLLNCYRRGVPGIQPALSVGSLEAFFRIAANRHSCEFILKEHIQLAELRPCVGYFEDCGLLRRLSPWPAKLNGEATLHPKLFVRDSGLLHAILRLWTPADIRQDARAYGASWEGFCVESLIAASRGLSRPYHFRASKSEQKDEVDLILDFDRARVVVECKAGDGNLSPGFFRVCSQLKPTHMLAIRDVPERFDDRSGVRHLRLREAVRLVEAIVDVH